MRLSPKLVDQPSLLTKVAAALLILNLALAAIAQDISGGAGVLLANAEVEAKLGKGIFTPAQNKPHVNKAPDKKPLRRTVAAAHPRTNSGGNRPTNTGNTSGNRNTGNTGGTRPAMDAEAYNKQGDDFFDAGKYDQAAESYQQAVKLRSDYAEAYLNLGETYFNLGRYDEAITADNKAISLNSNSADAYRALGLAQLHKNNLADAVAALKHANQLNGADAETKNALSLAYYDEGVDAYNANNFSEAVARYQVRNQYQTRLRRSLQQPRRHLSPIKQGPGSH